jgi:hypothetical protein
VNAIAATERLQRISISITEIISDLSSNFQIEPQYLTRGELEDKWIIPPPAPIFKSPKSIYRYESLRSSALGIDGLIKDIFEGLETHPAYEEQISRKLHAAAARKLRRRQARDTPGQQSLNLPL